MSQYTKTALVYGAGGFIGSHMVKRLRSEGYWVRGVDIKYPEYSISEANEFILGDLTDFNLTKKTIEYKGELGNFSNDVSEEQVTVFFTSQAFQKGFGA